MPEQVVLLANSQCMLFHHLFGAQRTCILFLVWVWIAADQNIAENCGYFELDIRFMLYDDKLVAHAIL